MKEKSFVCIMCPAGCEIRVGFDESGINSIEGNTCKRGEEYVSNELFHPTRTLTSTVRCTDGSVNAVKTTSPIPKDKIPQVMDEINKIRPEHPAFGQVIIHNVCGTGADIVSVSIS